MTYRIKATVTRAGNTPVEWTRFSENKMTMQECEKLLHKPKEAGKSFGDKVTLTNFRCDRVKERI
ncbi:hypothetical protein CYD30_25055 [Kosakonia cowanii]|nr:hypothetical protein CYD30_25055 [Kosakonia cowanii]